MLEGWYILSNNFFKNELKLYKFFWLKYWIGSWIKWIIIKMNIDCLWRLGFLFFRFVGVLNGMIIILVLVVVLLFFIIILELIKIVSL